MQDLLRRGFHLKKGQWYDGNIPVNVKNAFNRVNAFFMEDSPPRSVSPEIPLPSPTLAATETRKPSNKDTDSVSVVDEAEENKENIPPGWDVCDGCKGNFLP